MPRPALPALLLTAVICLGIAPHARAQNLRSGDPRITEDPRRSSDPRGLADPRDADVKPGIEESQRPLVGPDLFDELYENSNHAALSQAMAENPWALTDYIYDQCANWIRLSEDQDGEPVTPTAESKAAETKLRDLARLADVGLGDTRFSYSVDKVCSLSAKDRVLRKEQEQLLDRGAAVIDTAYQRAETLGALTPLRQSLSRAQQIDDLWGQSRSLSLIGRVQSLNDRSAAARASGQEAVRIGRSVRDLESVWNGWAVIMQAAIRQQDFRGAQLALMEQRRISVEIGDEVTAQEIENQVLALESALGGRIPDSLIIYAARLDQMDFRRRIP
jgi:hypothetical protein